jgi:hypothetical protein
MSVSGLMNRRMSRTPAIQSVLRRTRMTPPAWQRDRSLPPFPGPHAVPARRGCCLSPQGCSRRGVAGWLQPHCQADVDPLVEVLMSTWSQSCSASQRPRPLIWAGSGRVGRGRVVRPVPRYTPQIRCCWPRWRSCCRGSGGRYSWSRLDIAALASGGDRPAVDLSAHRS